jgi:hypothetical protein
MGPDRRNPLKTRSSSSTKIASFEERAAEIPAKGINGQLHVKALLLMAAVTAHDATSVALRPTR